MAEVLVFENDAAAFRTIERILGTSDHVVHPVESPASLRQRLSRTKPPDILLAGHDQYDRVRRLVSDLELTIPVVLLTSEARLKGKTFPAKDAPDDVVTYPVRRHEFLFRVAKVIECSAQRREFLRRQKEEFRKFIDIASTSFSMVEPDKVLYHLVKELSHNMPVFRCSVLRVDERRKRIDVLSTHEDPNGPNLRLELEKYPEVRVACRKKQPVVVKDTQADPLTSSVRAMLADKRIHSILVIPLGTPHKHLNHLYLRASSSERPFSEGEIHFVRELGRASSGAIHRAFVFEKLESEKKKYQRMAATDALTGLYNLRYMGKRLDQEFSRAVRHRLSLSCMMLDLDNFKEINDRLGHKCGDGVLLQFARLIEENFRKSDVVARYGGDEFVVLMPQSDTSGAVLEAERLVHRVKGHRFRGLNKGMTVSVSIGFASFPNDRIKAASDLVACADHALLDAKKQGRNQIAVCH